MDKKEFIKNIKDEIQKNHSNLKEIIDEHENLNLILLDHYNKLLNEGKDTR